MDLSAWTSAVRTSAEGILGRVAARLPEILGAALLLLVGWLLARLARAVIAGLLRRLLDRLGRGRLGADGGLGADEFRLRGSPQGTGDGLGPATEPDTFGLRHTLPPLVAGVGFWAVLLVFGVAAVDTLGLRALGDLLGALARYLPQVLAGVLIVFAGIVLSGPVRDGTTNAAAAAGIAYAPALGRAAQVSVIGLALVMGADQAGMESTFLVILLPVVLGMLLLGAALAFGLGARTAVANIIAAYHLLQIYEVGQRVRVAGFEGRIVQVTPTAVLLETGDGRAAVPASLFSEQASLLLTEGPR